ncbi:MAG TPA: pyridoxamine 5'-phosphate oxidase family protein [Anaerolineales bacterium]
MSIPKPERPLIPETYGFTVSTPHKPPSWQSIEERIRTSRNYWICSVSSDGSPHALPVWGIWLDNQLYFVTKRASKKGRNLLANPKVAIHLESGDDVIAFQGRVMEITDSLHLAKIADIYSEKYNGDQIYPDIEVVFQLVPRFAFTWLERNYHETATRWRFQR